MKLKNIYKVLMALSLLIAVSPFMLYFAANIAAYSLGCEPVISSASACNDIAIFGVLFQLSYYWIVTVPLGVFCFLMFGFLHLTLRNK